MYNGVEFLKCTDTDHDAQWCATKTDSEGKFMNNEWGNCDVGCPGFRGIAMLFYYYRCSSYLIPNFPFKFTFTAIKSMCRVRA